MNAPQYSAITLKPFDTHSLESVFPGIDLKYRLHDISVSSILVGLTSVNQGEQSEAISFQFDLNPNALTVVAASAVNRTLQFESRLKICSDTKLIAAAKGVELLRLDAGASVEFDAALIIEIDALKSTVRSVFIANPKCMVIKNLPNAEGLADLETLLGSLRGIGYSLAISSPAK